jgi:hypothetical protein
LLAQFSRIGYGRIRAGGPSTIVDGWIRAGGPSTIVDERRKKKQ